MSMVKQATAWLVRERRCLVVLTERWPLFYGARPDVFGVLPHRRTIEVEIKRTLSDFRADDKKTHIANREQFAHQLAHYTYYMVTQEIADSVRRELPTWAGMLVYQPLRWDPDNLKRAPENKLARKLSLKQICKLGLLMGFQLTARMGWKVECVEDYAI